MPHRLITLALVLVASASLLLVGRGALGAQSSDNKAVKALAVAYQKIRQGQIAQAIAVIDEQLRTTSDSSVGAKALLLRGEAYERAGKPAQALADFTGAIWLQSLTTGERERAVAGRKRVMARLGLGGKAGARNSPAAVSRTRAPSASRSASSGAWQTSVNRAPGAAPANGGNEGSGSLSRLFGGLFGDSKAQSGQRARSAAQSATSWSQGTSVTNTAAATVTSGKIFRIQLASLSSQDAAASEARRLAGKLGDALGGRKPEIVTTNTRAGNTYFRVMVGPFAEFATPRQMCREFEQRGVSCLVVSSKN